jgi:hypothetical protein
MLISDARGRLRPEVTSPVDEATMFGFLFMFYFRLSFTSRRYSHFSVFLLEMAEKRFRPIGGV